MAQLRCTTHDHGEAALCVACCATDNGGFCHCECHQDGPAMACPVCGIADVRDTSDGGWKCRRCGSSDKRLSL